MGSYIMYFFFFWSSFTQHKHLKYAQNLTTSYVNTTGQATIISHLKDCNSLLTLLPASALPSQSLLSQ